MAPQEIHSEYELNTGHAIIRRFEALDPLHTPAVLVAGHAPFAWGPDPAEAAHMAVIVEELAHLAYLTFAINAQACALPDVLRDKHFLRKHGSTAYYGQPQEAK
jgi:L-ribulose-5-phosphate 4-epimerase